MGSKKLHKLLYYCQGYHLAAFGEPLFSESVSAWDMGPVVGKLWHSEQNDQAGPEAAELANSQLNTIGYVLSRYGRLSGTDLERLTHAEPPWQEADAHRIPGTSAHIPNDALRAYFASSDAWHAGDEPPNVDSDALRAFLEEASQAVSSAGPAPSVAETIDMLQVRLARDLA